MAFFEIIGASDFSKKLKRNNSAELWKFTRCASPRGPLGATQNPIFGKIFAGFLPSSLSVLSLRAPSLLHQRRPSASSGGGGMGHYDFARFASLGRPRGRATKLIHLRSSSASEFLPFLFSLPHPIPLLCPQPLFLSLPPK